MTGYDLLNWLHKQSPADLNKPIGVCGHYGEFHSMTEFPEARKARIKWDEPKSIEVLVLEKIDVGPEQD